MLNRFLSSKLLRLLLINLTFTIVIWFLPEKGISEILYAKNECNAYNGPSDQSGNFFFSPKAKGPITLTKNREYQVQEKENGWVKVAVFDKSAWVRRECLDTKIHHMKNALRKYGLVCRTKEQFKEAIDHKNDKAYLLQMMYAGKCKLNLTDYEVPLTIIEGVMPMVKVEMRWNDEIFTGWTELKYVNQ